ncbi:MAG: right-handed parallel beta-helix repeat-containing protein [Dehalococcoidia bacterium]
MTLALHGKSRRRRTWLLMAALVAVVLGITGSLTLDRTETKADSTTVVKVADLTAPAGGGWLFYDDNTDTYDNTPGVLGDFAMDLTAPAGDGSASLAIDGGTKSALTTYQFGGTALTNISELKFSAKNATTSPAFLNLNVDFDLSNTWQFRLIYVPTGVTAGSWQNYDAIQAGAAMWKYSKNGFWPAPNDSVPSGPGGTALSWAQILTDYPNVRVLPSDPFTGIRIDPGPAGTTYLDNFIINISGDQKTFDFEPTVQCTTDCYVDSATGNDLNGGGVGDPKATIQAAIAQVSSGGTVHVAAGTYLVTSTIDVNKAVTITGTGTPVIQVSGAGDRIKLSAPGSTIQGFKIEKTDKASSDIVRIMADDTTITGNEFSGQYVFGDPEVSRAMVMNAGSFSGISITNNVIHDLRQPMYNSGTNTGVVSGNYTYKTKGWVIEGGNLTFTNNTWGVGANQNIVDIAILSAVPLIYYTDVPAMSATNNDAYIEDQRTVPATMSIVYVAPWGNDANLGTAADPKKTIQAGITRVVIGGTVHVLPGTYHEDVLINKAGVKLFGAGVDSAIVSGVDQLTDPRSATIQVAAANVLVDGFTITRDGNAAATWDVVGNQLNSAGVAVQSQGNTVELRNSKLTGNRTGVDVNNSNGNSIHNNIIDNNRTGLIFRNQTDNTIVKNNFITNNWTVGIVFLDGSSGSNTPVQQALGSEFNENDLSGNWFGAVDDRQEGGSLPPAGTYLKNFEDNWWGVVPPTVNTAQSSEPGYGAQIPAIYPGGSATNPGGANSIYGTAEENIDFDPYLCSGTDTSPAVGFQPIIGCGDIEVVAPATANVGDTGINVTVVANNADNLFGVQAKVTYSAGLQLTNVTLGPGLSPDFVTTNTTSPGVVAFAFTEQAPTAPVSGSGVVLATLTFTAVGAGTANIDIVPANTLFSNNDGFPIGPNAVTNDSISVTATGTGDVTGTIFLQGRTNHSGATAEINPPAFPGVGSPLATTNSSGVFTIVAAPQGTPTIRARMLGYLLALKTITVNAGSNSAGSSVTLLGGDANMDATINILDLSLIAAYFGQSPAYAPALAANTTPDINGDNVVNILDLSLTAANFGAVGPQVWAP